MSLTQDLLSVHGQNFNLNNITTPHKLSPSTVVFSKYLSKLAVISYTRLYANNSKQEIVSSSWSSSSPEEDR